MREAGEPFEQVMSVAAFDRAYQTITVDDALLAPTAARALKDASSKLLEMLFKIDSALCAQKPSWWARFTGADLEQRVTLAGRLKDLENQHAHLQAARKKAEDISARLTSHISNVRAAQDANAALLEQAHMALDAAVDVAGRLERRVANAEAVFAATDASVKQLDFIAAQVQALIDKASDIQQFVLPLFTLSSVTSSQIIEDPHIAYEQGKALRDCRVRVAALKD